MKKEIEEKIKELIEQREFILKEQIKHYTESSKESASFISFADNRAIFIIEENLNWLKELKKMVRK